jgi:hypothetical protein
MKTAITKLIRKNVEYNGCEYVDALLLLHKASLLPNYSSNNPINYEIIVANSEKYIICINYKNNNKKIITNIIENFDLIINNIDSISSLFNLQLNKHFLTKIQEINAIYGEQQLENISATLNLIKELKVLNIKYNLINNEYSSLFKYLHIHTKYINANCLLNEIDDAYIGLDISSAIISKNSTIKKSIIDNTYYTNANTNANANDYANANANDYTNEYFTKLNNIVIANIHKSINWCKKHQFAINKEFSCY